MVKRGNKNLSYTAALDWIGVDHPFRKLNKGEKKILVKAALLLSTLSLSWITFGENGMLRYFEVKNELSATINKKETLADQNRELKEQITKIQNDPEYLEEVARKQYYMTKKNEVIFRFD
ncbi:MAG: FtsB family cell division protein [Desulfurivibrionaceae bacterium]